DGFTGFTPLQNELMLIFMRIADKIRISLTLDPDEEVYTGIREDELFAVTKRTAISLGKMAQSVRCERLPDIRLRMDENSRFPKENAIAFLERNIFKNNGAVYKEDASEVCICGCKDPRREIEYAAAYIHRLIRKEGLRYRDFAVCSYAPETYSPYVEGIFASFGIPVFIDEKSVIAFSPCIEFYTSAIELFVYDFNYESVMHFLRSAPWVIEQERADLFDRYLTASGIRGIRAYETLFKASPADITPDELIRVNEIREELILRFAPLCRAFREADCTVDMVTRALYEMGVSFYTEEGLKDLEARAYEAGDEKKTREYAEVYGITIDLMDQLVDLLGNEKTDPLLYLELFSAGMENAKVGRIPSGNDSVLIGDIERTRIDGIRCLILLGANDGVIPKTVMRGGLLSQADRMKLSEGGMEMAPSDREQTFMQRFYLYMAITKPSERLCITYSQTDSEGVQLRPSYLITNLTESLPRHFSGGYDRELMWTESERGATGEFIRILRAIGDGEDYPKDMAAGLLSSFEKNDREKMNVLLSAADKRYEGDPISRSVLRAIDKGVIKGSVSRMESFMGCSERFFLQYILGLKEPVSPDIEAVDMGTLYHEALYRYESGVSKDGLTLSAITDEDSDRILDGAVEEAFGGMEKPHILSSARQREILRRMKDTLRRTVWALRLQAAAGEYEPGGFEVSLEEAMR
ncbi:MAG: exodeoxyribonuclease V subunit gamma, partial [Lachnospiraceae bacterium]|nr:exodeoxyribonuclease V subunit gamma [Lachnospiraceae bacterium]